MKLNEAIKAYQEIKESYNAATRAASCKESQHFNWYNTYISLRNLRNTINDKTRKSAGKGELLETIDAMKQHINDLVKKYLHVDIRHEIFKQENNEQHADNFKSQAQEAREWMSEKIERNLSKWDHKQELTTEALEAGKHDKNLMNVIRSLSVSITIDDESDAYFLDTDNQHLHLNYIIKQPNFLEQLKAFLIKACIEPITAYKFEQEADDAYYEYWQHDADYWSERD